MLNALTPSPILKPTTSIHRLQHGLPGYLILFDPHAFEPQRQLIARYPPSPPVFYPISTNFTSTLGIPISSLSFKSNSYNGNSKVELWYFTAILLNRLHSLYAQ